MTQPLQRNLCRFGIAKLRLFSTAETCASSQPIGHLIASLRLQTSARSFVPRTGMQLHGWRAAWAAAERTLAPALGIVEEKHEARKGSRGVPERGSEESGTQKRQESSARTAQGEGAYTRWGRTRRAIKHHIRVEYMQEKYRGGFIPLRPVAAAATIACCCCCAGRKHVGWG